MATLPSSCKRCGGTCAYPEKDGSWWCLACGECVLIGDPTALEEAQRKALRELFANPVRRGRPPKVRSEA